MRESRFVTVAKCSTPTEASVLKAKLDSAGIWSMLADAETIGMIWIYSNALGGVKLRVRAEDAELARELLDEDPPGETLGLSVGDDTMLCPECGSKDTEFERYSRKFAFLSWLLLMVPLPYWKNSWKCRECGYTWREDSEGDPPAAA